MKIPLSKVAGQPGWKFSSTNVSAFLTRAGGQLAPVEFRLGRKTIQPFSISPWWNESISDQPKMLQVCRGDFFCAPFGGNAVPYRGERHPPHGETANRDWSFHSLEESDGAVTLHTSLRTRVRVGRIDKRLTLRNGHTAVYCEHVLSGFTGPMPIGTHPILKIPEEAGAGTISTSGFVRGYVVPTEWERPEAKGYSWLKLGARFSSLKRVPACDGTRVDLSQYPARTGYEEVVQMVSDARQPFAWSAVTLPRAGYVFLAIKNPRVLRETVFWLSNGGRHYPPWNGRHTRVLGVEDVTAFFHLGLAASARPNFLNRAGAPTAMSLSPRRPLRVAHILAVAAIPTGFDEVKSVVPDAGGIRLVARNGREARAAVDPGFVMDGD